MIEHELLEPWGLVYFPAFRVLICENARLDGAPCRFALSLDCLKSHLHRRSTTGNAHSDRGAKLSELVQARRCFARYELPTKEAKALRDSILKIPELSNCIQTHDEVLNMGPFPYRDGKRGDERIVPMVTVLADPIEGFYCTQCDRGGTSWRYFAYAHWKECHKEIEPLTPSPLRYVQHPYMQSLSWDPGYIRMFPVQAPPIEDVDSESNSALDLGDLLEDEEDRIFPNLDDEDLINLDGVSFEGFFTTVGAIEHVHGHDNQHLRRLVSLPEKGSEPELAALRLPAVTYVLDNCPRIEKVHSVLRHRVLHPDAG